MTWPMLLTVFLSAVATPAFAGPDDFEVDDDDDDFTFEDAEEEEEEAPERLEEDDDLTVEEDEEALEEFVESEEQPAQDLLGEEGTAPVLQAGDSEQTYRATEARLARMPADEQLLGWDQYLQQYPNTVFRERIEARMVELEEQLYRRGAGSGSSGSGSGAGVDALDAQVDLAHAMQLGQLNPRTRLQAGFEWGLPDYINLFVDYEKAFTNKLSAHAGVRRRYSGFSVEIGPRIALVKSPRTNTIISFSPDVHFNVNPGFPAFSPTIAAGKRFGKVDAQVHVSTDIELRSELEEGGLSTTSKVRTRYHGGASIYVAASETVGFFGETYLNMRPVQADAAFDGGLFRFNVITFGMKFFPSVNSRPGERPVEANLGATVPYMQQYWQYHYGSVMGQVNYYPED
jgi:hypothetical protein